MAVTALRWGYTSVMTDSIRAIYENGVFIPLDTRNLPELQHVRLTVESIVPGTQGTAEADTTDPLPNVRIATGISVLAAKFDDYRFGRRHP